jgi:hypothetical protein
MNLEIIERRLDKIEARIDRMLTQIDYNRVSQMNDVKDQWRMIADLTNEISLGIKGEVRVDLPKLEE